MFSDYKETVNYLYSVLPMFQRVGATAFKGDLINTQKLCEFLGHPEEKFKAIHVAGTNGKGSTSHFLASILQSAGYKVGLYTSPHLKEFTERVKINGQEINHSFVIDFVNRIKPVIEEIKPSFFEITVALAFDYFASQNVDVAVIEVGLGGRLDSTNVITPVLSVVTNISWDHTDFLGDSLEKIAIEKAGIIKERVPVVVSERQPEVEDVFIKTASDKKAALFFASDHFKAVHNAEAQLAIFKDKKILRVLSVPLKGHYQRKNIVGVMMAIQLLREKFSIADNAVYEGVKNVIEQTGLKGRWQQLGINPLVLCDTGHNEDGIKEVVRQLWEQKFKRLFIVWGMVKDKDVYPILKLLPQEAVYFFTQAKIPRALDANELAKNAASVGLQGEVITDVNEAIEKAKSQATSDDLIFIGGSTFVVAEIDNL